MFLTETCWCDSKPASIRPALVVLASLFFQRSFKTRIWTVRVHLYLYGMVLVFLQGWCVKSSDPHTLGMNSVPKEVIPGQVSVTHFIFTLKKKKKYPFLYNFTVRKLCVFCVVIFELQSSILRTVKLKSC